MKRHRRCQVAAAGRLPSNNLLLLLPMPSHLSSSHQAVGPHRTLSCRRDLPQECQPHSSWTCTSKGPNLAASRRQPFPDPGPFVARNGCRPRSMPSCHSRSKDVEQEQEVISISREARTWRGTATASRALLLMPSLENELANFPSLGCVLELAIGRNIGAGKERFKQDRHTPSEASPRHLP